MSTCAQCKKEYRHGTAKAGCPKCAPNTVITEAEFQKPVQMLYRLEDVVYAAPLDEFDVPQGSGRLEVVTRKYRVVKTTPRGVWLDIGRFVLLGTRKQYAHPTLEDATVSFIARKRRQQGIYEARAHRAEAAIALVSQKGLFA